MRSTLLLAAFASIALAAVTGCTRAPHLDTPRDFAELDAPDGQTQKAINANGVAIGVRDQKNEPRATLSFWSSTIDKKLKANGYVADGAPKKVTLAGGREGEQLRYKTTLGGRDHTYWLTLFVTDERVVVVEAAGDAEFFGAAAKDIEASVASLDLG